MVKLDFSNIGVVGRGNLSQPEAAHFGNLITNRSAGMLRRNESGFLDGISAAQTRFDV
jgi:hypothetical protein